MRLSPQKLKSGFSILSWALYDLANQFFALNVVSLYFVRWLTFEKKAPEIYYSISFGISMLLVGILAPILGTVSDLTGRRRVFLVYLTLLSVIFTMMLGVAGEIILALLFFAIANFGCQMAVVFYNALMVNIAPVGKIGLVSGFGRMLGYSGAILALYLIKPVVLKQGYQAAFLPTGILFLVFALPCLIFVKDKAPKGDIKLTDFFKKDKALEILQALKTSMANASKIPALPDFLKAMFFGLCAVNVIILFMSVYATRVFALNETQVINLIGFSTLFAIAGSFFSGLISDYLGYKRCLCSIFILWAVCFLLGALVRNSALYWLIGALVGIALGSIWVVSRATAVKLVPEEKIGEVFGLFNLMAYSSAIVGALFWGVLLFFFCRLGELGYRLALSSLVLFMLLGLVFLLRLPALVGRK